MLTAIIYSSEFGGNVPLNTQLSLRNPSTATRSEEPQILNFLFQVLLEGRGERMLKFELLGGGKICFQVAAYYSNC